MHFPLRLLAAWHSAATRPGTAGIFAGYYRLIGICVRGGKPGAISGYARPHRADPRRRLHGFRRGLTATSVLFFQLLHDVPLQFLWAPVAWWESRMFFAVLLLVALLVERFLPHSHHPRQELVGALVTVVAATYLISAALRRLPAEVSPHPAAFFPARSNCCPVPFFLLL